MLSDNDVEFVDFRFCDLPGLMQHFSVPATQLTEDVFEDGYGFDGSSIRGFQEIQESDMILLPDPNTAVPRPVPAHKTLNINCFVRDPVTGEPYSRDPRYVAKKAEDYLASTGIADTAYFGPEAEFFIFDDVRYSYTSTRRCTRSTRSRASGTPAGTRARTSASSPATRRATSPSRPWTTTRTCARRSRRRSSPSASRSRCSTTRWPPAGRPRSTCASTPCCPWPTS